MKTYKKGISLIVLVITVIVLAILSTAVIISLSNTNIINEASKAVFRNDMASYKEAYSLYLVDYMIEHGERLPEEFNVRSSDTEFTEIFGDNVKDEYKEKLQIVDGKLVYKTLDPEKTKLLEELGMAVKIIKTSEVKVGALVNYTPTVDPSGSYEGATYVKDTDTTSSTYDTYIESTTNYTPGNLTWVYLGQDENGNILLTSRETTAFTLTIDDQDGWATGPDRMDTLCNKLYGNSKYGTARNMKVEDVNRTLGYTGPKGTYRDADNNEVTTDEPMTFWEIETATGVTISNRKTPRLSETAFEDYLSDYYSYKGTTYKAYTTDEYKLIFKKENSTTSLPTYWLSSPAADFRVGAGFAYFRVRSVNSGYVNTIAVFYSYGADGGYGPSYALRPVIVLKSNIHFGEPDANGKLTLVEM